MQRARVVPSSAIVVREAMRLGRNGAMQGLPLFAKDIRAASVNRAGSIMAGALPKVVQPDEGRQWQQERKAILAASFRCNHGLPMREEPPLYQ